ncbi:hypothetical protein ACFZAG_17015 [Streptomyces sp. NPDC012403]|nr:hypothetical protein [Streptomyces sp. AC558_RSS880]
MTVLSRETGASATARADASGLSTTVLWPQSGTWITTGAVG